MTEPRLGEPDPAKVLAEMVDERLSVHPAVQLNLEWTRLAVRAQETLHELYQAIAREHMK